MIFYHFSDANLSILEPKIGFNRNLGEDPLAVNNPVIYLTTCGDMIFNGRSKFRYTVNIDFNDQFLNPDSLFNSDMELMSNSTRWYFYTKSLKPIKKEKWNGKNYE